MTDAYDGKTGADYDELLDSLARTCAADDSAEIAALYTPLPTPTSACPPRWSTDGSAHGRSKRSH